MSDLPPLREVIARHGLDARKALGQNFLLDLNLTGRIARAAGPFGDHPVYEVGPGPGGLTRALLDAGASQVVAVEKDARCLDALAEVAAHHEGRLHVVPGDALKVDEPSLLDGRRAIVAANLPYNVATVLLAKWLEQEAWPPWWLHLTLMFQKEVAERLVAQPGTHAYGRLSILVQWRARASALFDIGPKAFVPPPKVTSTVVRIEPLATPVAPADRQWLTRVTAMAFGQRRKMLRQSLKPLGGGALAEEAGVAPEARPEDLDIPAFCALARAAQGRAQAADPSPG
ncbi:16S rRNA (adenine(1518)-N(6)/adenine(1519)-N(6))-dimethyltransferase RsmA [Zavarzinia sp. CC-PAN008]|uniref:16S rRNA (adenine(1518)-N(6)/adenine(1519)-N(6))- dimethyltransferase RsmA n=1 Tax=Zavarzinia sp. CC-PAN008 TaxID=3243332 RepID=UPI003F744F19